MLGAVSGFAVVVLLVVVLGLLVLGALAGAVALLTAWLRSLWHEFRSTPVVSELSRSANLAKPLVAYRDSLRLAPPEATTRTMRIQRKALALERISDRLGDEERFRVGETTRRYLPDTMQAYRLAVTGADAGSRREASKLLIEQLARIEEGVDEAASTAGEQGMRVLEANGRFLAEISEDRAEPDLSQDRSPGGVPDRLLGADRTAGQPRGGDGTAGQTLGAEPRPDGSQDDRGRDRTLDRQGIRDAGSRPAGSQDGTPSGDRSPAPPSTPPPDPGRTPGNVG